jgi:hypothetical protein
MSRWRRDQALEDYRMQCGELKDNLQGRVYTTVQANRVAEQLRIAYADSPYTFEVVEGGTFGRIEVSAGCSVLGFY